MERPAAARSAARLCFGCGDDNAEGLQMQFRVGEGRAEAEYVAGERYQGYPGFVHGGIVATLLDEAMGWAAYSVGSFSLTGRMTIRYREPAPLGQRLTVAAEVSRARGASLAVRGELRDGEGRLLAEADGLFLRARGERAEQLRRAYEQRQNQET